MLLEPLEGREKCCGQVGMDLLHGLSVLDGIPTPRSMEDKRYGARKSSTHSDFKPFPLREGTPVSIEMHRAPPVRVEMRLKISRLRSGP